MTPNDQQSSRQTPDDVIRDDRPGGLMEEQADQGQRRKGPKPAGPGEPVAPMSPTPQSGPLDEPEDPVDPAAPPGETIR
jgi:hypothetical protein